MPFTEPYRAQDQIDQVRKIGRLAQLLLEMRTEYEHKPRRIVLQQIIERIDELTALRAELAGGLETDRSVTNEGE